jgi:glucokinase
MKGIIIGVDIGGTSIKMGLLNENGEILYKWEIPTNIKDNGRFIVEDIWKSLKTKLEKKQIDYAKVLGIGVGVPGFIDKRNGRVYQAVNIGWENIELAKQLKKLSNRMVFLENDANAAALGENWKGAGNQARDLLVITLGTGVGSGVITNGNILNGTNGTAGEIGHIMVDPQGYPCNCGRTGCLDTVASANGIVRQAMDAVEQNPDSGLAKFYNSNGGITSKDIFHLAAKGDRICERIINHAADVLSYALASAAALINPSRMIIGGGLSKAGDQLISKVSFYFKKYTLERINEVCEIKIAELGNDAGIIGAAYLVKQNLQEKDVTLIRG